MRRYNGRVCPHCHANLDSGEPCDCPDAVAEREGRSAVQPRRLGPRERTEAQVLASGNRWAIENYRATHG